MSNTSAEWQKITEDCPPPGLYLLGGYTRLCTDRYRWIVTAGRVGEDGKVDLPAVKDLPWAFFMRLPTYWTYTHMLGPEPYPSPPPKPLTEREMQKIFSDKQVIELFTGTK